MMAGIAGCLVIPTTTYDDVKSGSIRSPKTKAELLSTVRIPDAQTLDGRFYLYALDGTTDWYGLFFGYPTEDPLVSTDKQVRVLYEFDKINRIKKYDIRKCDDVPPNLICSDQGDASLWAFIQELRGDEFVALYRRSADASARHVHPWHDAARTGDIETLERFLSLGVSLQTEFNGQTALHVAVQQGNIDAVRFLIGNDAAIETLDATVGRTPVNIAAGEGRIEIVNLLLAHGAEVNTRDIDGRTPLYSAALQGHIEVVERLIAVGADIHTKTNGRTSPLYVAVREGHTAVAKILIANGANVKVTPKKSGTALSAASRRGDIEMVKLLLDNGANVNSRGYFLNGRSPLNVAVERGQTAVVELLIANGANVNSKGAWFMPLHSAISNGDSDTAALLLAHGAKVNATILIHDDRRYFGWRRVRPMELAMQLGRGDLVELLRKHGGVADHIPTRKE